MREKIRTGVSRLENRLPPNERNHLIGASVLVDHILLYLIEHSRTYVYLITLSRTFLCFLILYRTLSYFLVLCLLSTLLQLTQLKLKSATGGDALNFKVWPSQRPTLNDFNCGRSNPRHWPQSM